MPHTREETIGMIAVLALAASVAIFAEGPQTSKASTATTTLTFVEAPKIPTVESSEILLTLSQSLAMCQAVVPGRASTATADEFAEGLPQLLIESRRYPEGVQAMSALEIRCTRKQCKGMATMHRSTDQSPKFVGIGPDNQGKVGRQDISDDLAFTIDAAGFIRWAAERFVEGLPVGASLEAEEARSVEVRTLAAQIETVEVVIELAAAAPPLLLRWYPKRGTLQITSRSAP